MRLRAPDPRSRHHLLRCFQSFLPAVYEYTADVTPRCLESGPLLWGPGKNKKNESATHCEVKTGSGLGMLLLGGIAAVNHQFAAGNKC